MKNIWQDLKKPFFILAPMEDVTDHIFRRVVAHSAKPDLFFSEFTNATGWVHAGEKATRGRLIISKNEKHPIIAQIWGTIPNDIEALARHCKKLGFKGIDINMGCPDKGATRSGGGAAMCQTPELAAEVIAAAKKAGLPVSVKCRLGYSDLDEWSGWLEHLLKQDLAALTVHLRTKKEMSKVPAHWELMPEIKELRDKISPKTLLIGNGDVDDRQHGEALIKQTGIDGIMIGRGIFTNIFAFEKSAKKHDKSSLLKTLDYHLVLFEKENTVNRPFETLKRFFKIYVRDFDGAHELRSNLMNSSSVVEARAIIKDALNPLLEPEHHFAGLAHLSYHKQMHHQVKAIVFDSDGTLVNTKKLILHGYKTVLKKYNLEHLATDEYITKRLGKPVPETYQQIIAGHKVSISLEKLVEEHDRVQNNSTHLIKPYPQTEQLLKSWKKMSIKLCLFTSGNKMMIERNFTAAGIKKPFELFDAIITADDDLPRKPEPDAILELLNRVGVEPKDAVVVGDHPYDIVSGKRANAALKIGILHGFGETKELMQAGADALSDDLVGLDHILSFAVD
jgi:HAD superfamily hydrolase (TIGR01549 family)